jgi:hypothetical protein
MMAGVRQANAEGIQHTEIAEKLRSAALAVAPSPAPLGGDGEMVSVLLSDGEHDESSREEEVAVGKIPGSRRREAKDTALRLVRHSCASVFLWPLAVSDDPKEQRGHYRQKASRVAVEVKTFFSHVGDTMRPDFSDEEFEGEKEDFLGDDKSFPATEADARPPRYYRGRAVAAMVLAGDQLFSEEAADRRKKNAMALKVKARVMANHTKACIMGTPPTLMPDHSLRRTFKGNASILWKGDPKKRYTPLFCSGIEEEVSVRRAGDGASPRDSP